LAQDNDELVVREERAGQEPAASLLGAFGADIATIYGDWDPSRGPSATPTDFEPPTGGFVVAYRKGVAVGGGGLKRLDDGVAEIKRMYVAPEARSQGVARRILEALEELARERGYSRIRLDTGPEQPHALALYQSAGYRAIEDYNDNPYATFWFEKILRQH
jgi:GNAT superfamily N-acetyltransferase